MLKAGDYVRQFGTGFTGTILGGTIGEHGSPVYTFRPDPERHSSVPDLCVSEMEVEVIAADTEGTR